MVIDVTVPMGLDIGGKDESGTNIQFIKQADHYNAYVYITDHGKGIKDIIWPDRRPKIRPAKIQAVTLSRGDCLPNMSIHHLAHPLSQLIYLARDWPDPPMRTITERLQIRGLSGFHMLYSNNPLRILWFIND